MIIFATYDDYLNLYAPVGKVFNNAKEFAFYARKATREIKRFTLNNIDENNIPENVILCCCELAETFYNSAMRNYLNNANANIASESVGDWSVSYNSVAADEQERQLLKVGEGIIFKWLSGTGLLYRGVKIC